MPIVAVDTSFTYIARTGMSRYITCLLQAINEISPPDIDLREIGFRHRNDSYKQPRRTLLTLTREYLWQPYLAPRLLKKLGVHALHTTFSASFGKPKGIKHIATIHDLSPIHTPERYRPWSRYRAKLDLLAASQADHVICVSESTARDFTKFTKFPFKRISVTHLASSFTKESPEEAPSMPLPSKYFLFVGSLEAGKNLNLIRETYRLSETMGKDLLPLVIVGSRIPGLAEEGLPPANWVYLGRQSDAALAYLYRRARALILPSKNEGFGLPVVEAMTLGCPVICSNLSSLPEVGGDAAIYPCAQTPEAYLEVVYHLQNSDSEFTARREAGLRKAAAFSWRRCASETLEVYRTTCHGIL